MFYVAMFRIDFTAIVNALTHFGHFFHSMASTGAISG
jgi:hypothetical protein